MHWHQTSWNVLGDFLIPAIHLLKMLSSMSYMHPGSNIVLD